MIIPAIDLQGGNSVRLYQGQFNEETLVNASPVAQAQAINAAGISCLHLVDLDGAKNGRPQNLETIKQIRQQFNGKIELGGGIRDRQTVNQYLKLGIDRVILGSLVVQKPQLAKSLIKKLGPDKIVIGVDGKDGLVATEGWLNQSTLTMADLINEMAGAGATQYIVTDISKDGTMKGPNTTLLANLQEQFPDVNIIASGGIRNRADINADINRLQKAGLKDMIAGKSIYEGTLTLKEVAEVNSSAS